MQGKIIIEDVNVVTETQQKIRAQIQEIYAVLVKLGYPYLVQHDPLTNYEQIRSFLSEYFQPTKKRNHLQQFLILILNPLTPTNSTLESQLWQLGVLPQTKHTKNLSYKSYIQGTLGYQNSIHLIYNLCELCSINIKMMKSKEDRNFGLFLEDVFENYQELVNVQYQPYNVGFPSAFVGKVGEQEIQEMFLEVQQEVDKIDIGNDEGKEYANVIDNFEQKKDIFEKKYIQLVEKIDETIVANKDLIDNYKQQQYFNHRLLKIDPNIVPLYRKYQKIVKKKQFYSVSFKEVMDILVQENVMKLNESVQIDGAIY